MDKATILKIVDANSGGVKGLELMTEIIAQTGSVGVNPVTFYDEIEAIIGREISELGFLRYGHKIDEEILREKVFIYRRLDCSCEKR